MAPVEPADAPDELAIEPEPRAEAVVPDREETPLQAALREHDEFLRSRKVPPPANRKERRERRRTLDTITIACLEGERWANEELAEGYFGRAQHGLMDDCFDRYARAAWDRYKVGFHLMGCVMDDRSGSLAGCYNHVMDRAILKEHGPEVLENLWQEVCSKD